MSKQVRVNGVTYTVPDNATLDQIQEYLATKGVTAPTNAAPPAGTPPGFSDERTRGQVALEQAGNVIRGVPQAITGIPATLGAMFSAVGNPGKQWELLKAQAGPVTTLYRGARALVSPESGPAPTPEEFQQAAQGTGTFAGGLLAAKVAPVLSQRVADVLPQELRAGKTFQTIMGKAQDIPVDLTEANKALAEHNFLEKTGSQPSSLMRKFERFQQPKTVGKMGGVKMQVAPEPMTYKVGRRFASKAGELSAAERMKLDPSMKRVVGDFARAMKDANREAAAKVGMADLYDQAMKEFRAAKRIGEAKAVVRKYAVKGLVGTGVTAGLLYGVEREVEKYFGR